MSKRHKPGFRAQRRSGWGMDLYRNRCEGWIAGVCAGLADHWNVPNWMVRVIVVALVIFTGSVAFWAYIAAIFLLGTRRQAQECDEAVMESDDPVDSRRSGPRSRYRTAPTERLQRAQARMDAALGRIEVMERYVTSRRCQLNERFQNL